MGRHFFLFFAAVAAAVPSLAHAQWYSDSIRNTPVCTATSIQDYPKSCSDGSDGVIVTWEDARGGSGFRIYAQRLDANGKALWTTNGIAMAPAGSISQRYPIIAADGTGGAYVVWQDWRNSSNGIDLYGQHVTSSGTLGWDTNGKAVASSPADQTGAVITADGYGNAFVVWEDNNTSSTSQPDLWMNKLTTAGPQWGAGSGLALTTQSSKQKRAAICEDGAGGFYCAWDNDANNPTAIYAQRVDGTGKPLWGGQYGVVVFQQSSGSPSPNSKNVSIRRDGNQLLLAWETTNTQSLDGQDIFATRYTNTGTNIYYPNSVPICFNYIRDQITPVIFSDDSMETGQSPYNGFYTIFQNATAGLPTLAMVRFLADGITQHPASGISNFTSTANGVNGFSAVACPPGSAIVAWNDSRYDTCIFAQRIDRDLTKYFPGPPSTWGLPVCAITTSKATQVNLAPRTNGAIAVWSDYRNGSPDIYAQLIFKDGSLPIELASFRGFSPRSGEVDLSWQTASENACAGFEVQRRELRDGADNSWLTIGSFVTTPALRGGGTSNSARDYAFVDRTASLAKYEYRLVDISLSGERRAHGVLLVDAGSSMDAGGWSFGPNAPNPVTESTVIPVALATAALIDITLTDETGREVSRPIASRLFAAGQNLVTLHRTDLPLASGIYRASITATDPGSGALLWRSPKPLAIAVVR